MKVYIIRHGLAGDRLEWEKKGLDDTKRPLTKEGVKRTKNVAASLKRNVGLIGPVYSSPWLRALETAQIISSKINPEERVQSTPLLIPGASYQDLNDSLITPLWKSENAVTLVGHEPHLSQLTSWWLSSCAESFLILKKGSVSCLEFFRKPDAGRALLRWSLPAKFLTRS